MKIIFSSNVAWSVHNFRSRLLNFFKSKDHEIFVVANNDGYRDKLIDQGFKFFEIKFSNNKKNPLLDILLIFNYIKIYKKINPDIIFHNAVKPNIYGTIAADFLNIPTINNISGLGTVFIKKTFSTKLVRFLYRFSQKKATKVFFQNRDDFKLFINNKLIIRDKCRVLNGSGSDINYFKPLPKTYVTENFQFLFVGRLLYDKGIGEYIDAAKNLKKKYSNVDFNILGPFAENNSSSIEKDKFEKLVNLKVINYFGETDKVIDFLRNADCVVLPSYREGMSKALIESSCMGIPIVTTNVPGCRDVIEDNKTGFVCKVKNSKDLENKMEKMMNLNSEQISKMKILARARAVKFFDDSLVNKAYFDELNNIFN